MSSSLLLGQTDAVAELVQKVGRLGAWSWEIATDYLQWSSGMFDLLGLGPGSVSPSFDLYASLVHPADRACFMEPARLLKQGPTHDQVFRLVTPDGELRYLRTCSRIEYSADGDARRIIGVDIDITEVRQSIQTHRNYAQLMRALGNTLDIAVWQTDADGSNTIVLSRNSSEQWGAAGWDELTSIHPDDRPQVVAAWNLAMRNGRDFAADFRTWQNNSVTAVAARATPMLGESGEIIGWIGFTKQKTVHDNDNEQALVEQSGHPLTPPEIRAARGFLGWSAQQLADRAGVSFSTVRRVEAGEGVNVKSASLRAIQAAFEHAHVEFIRTASGAVGVVYNQPTP
jgi:PAS domain-containing protein/DNA-binding XRE family transcriptional regulator